MHWYVAIVLGSYTHFKNHVHDDFGEQYANIFRIETKSLLHLYECLKVEKIIILRV